MCNIQFPHFGASYPDATPKRHAKRVQSEKIDTHATIRGFYQEGYEQAEKDTIERAWEWMTSAKGEHTFEDFRKAMEEE